MEIREAIFYRRQGHRLCCRCIVCVIIGVISVLVGVVVSVSFFDLVIIRVIGAVAASSFSRFKEQRVNCESNIMVGLCVNYEMTFYSYRCQCPLTKLASWTAGCQ